jgi:hypothetical protein
MPLSSSCMTWVGGTYGISECREASSEWAAKSISKLHPQLTPMHVAHLVAIEGPGDSGNG